MNGLLAINCNRLSPEFVGSNEASDRPDSEDRVVHLGSVSAPVSTYTTNLNNENDEILENERPADLGRTVAGSQSRNRGELRTWWSP
jgi:hypothetical protein